jgi:hypothetical protein
MPSLSAIAGPTNDQRPTTDEVAASPAARRSPVLRAAGAEGHGAHDHAVLELLRAARRPAGDERHHLAPGGADVAGVRRLLLGRHALLLHDDLLADGVEVLLAVAVERDVVARLDGDQILEHLAVAADVPGQHDVVPLAGVGGAAVLPDGVLRHLPDGYPLPADLLHLPADLDDFRIDVDAGDDDPRDGPGLR